MKKFTLVAIFMALSNAIVADEIDNTIDFKSITPTQTTQSITQDADNLYQGIQSNPPQNATQNSQPIFTQTGYKSTKKGDFESEFGIGYIMSQFKAEQDWGGSKASSTATGHGADLFFSGSYYAGESWGVVFGLGTELINIDWKEPLYELFCYGSACSLDTNSNDFLMNLYFNFGFFKNILQSDKRFLRVFGNVGLSVNWIMGGFYERTINCSTYGCNTTLDDDSSAKPISIPFTLGLRYMFVENHGLELVGKYDLIKWNFSTKISSGGVPNFDTTISRNLSLSLRYIYKF